MKLFSDDNMKRRSFEWFGDVKDNFFGIVLIQPKHADNIGMVLRSALAMGANFVAITGTRYNRSQTDVHNVCNRIPVFEVDDPMAVVPKNSQKICIDLVDKATPLPNFTHPANGTYFFGPEDGFVPEEIVKQCQRRVLIPTWACLNLAVCASVVMYDRLRGKYQENTMLWSNE